MITLDTTKKYVLAVSGGVDSMTMLHMFASMSPRPDFYVVTVNHGIRSEAAQDCEFVCDYCRKLNVECRVARVDVPQYVRTHKVSVETAARILRYDALDSFPCDFVCLAHNLRDNAETVLMHVLRGSGAQGASGMKAQSGKYLRPLLEISREEIEQYARENDVPFVVDSTNCDIEYSRNFIRLKVLQPLKQLNPNAEKNVVRFARNVGADNDYLDSLVSLQNVRFRDGEASVPVDELLQPQPLAYRLICKVFAQLGVHKDIEQSHVKALIDLASGFGGRRVNLPFGFCAVNDYNFVTVCKAANPAVYRFEIPFVLGRIDTPLGTVTASKNPMPNALKLDLNALPKDAVLRTKRQGDSFTKFGGGSKPLKKYLIDAKIPQRSRGELLLLTSQSEVYAVLGVEISDKVKVSKNSDVCYVRIERGNDE